MSLQKLRMLLLMWLELPMRRHMLLKLLNLLIPYCILSINQFVSCNKNFNNLQFKYRYYYLEMVSEKWKIFALTFLTYSLIHGVRTSWASLKYLLNSPPYSFQPLFLGTLDMAVLITLAVSLNLIGPLIEKSGPKLFLLRGLACLSILLVVIGILLLAKVNVGWPYAIIYPLVGVGSCVGWPACIFILSHYFKKGLIFSIWTGSSQFGDFIALMTSFILVEQADLNPGAFLFVIALMLIGVAVLNQKLLPQQKDAIENVPQQSPVQRPSALVQEGDPPLSNDGMNGQDNGAKFNPINFITVWTLPGVPAYIISFLFVKSVNAVIVTWLVFYLSMIGMVSESRIIAVLWAVSTFIGGLLASYYNPNFDKKIFAVGLLASAILFCFLESVHLYPNETEVIIVVVACGLIYGGPFTLMTSSIPLLLSEKPKIRDLPGAKAAIVSAMEGYGLLFCGVSLLIIPAIGVVDLHWIASCYCAIGGLILLYQHLRESRQTERLQRVKRFMSEPNIQHEKEKQFNYSLPAMGRGDKMTRRVRKSELSSNDIPKNTLKRQTERLVIPALISQTQLSGKMNKQSQKSKPSQKQQPKHTKQQQKQQSPKLDFVHDHKEQLTNKEELLQHKLEQIGSNQPTQLISSI